MRTASKMFRFRYEKNVLGKLVRKEGVMCLKVVLHKTIEYFCNMVSCGYVEVYNEFSLQHEIGIFLRTMFPRLSVQFEKNISSFGFNKVDFLKKEIDISISYEGRLISIIELKYPRNGQYPEQMFKFCEDIAFVEQVKNAGIESAFFVAFVDDKNFYSGNCGGIYEYFRCGKTIEGRINKPTGKNAEDIYITIEGNYKILWRQCEFCSEDLESIRYSIVSIG